MAYSDKARTFFQSELKGIRNAGLYKEERTIRSAQAASIQVEFPAGAPSRTVINFCANNYLGLSSHPEVLQAAREGLDSRGFGLSSVRFICGTQALHVELERRVARFLGMDDAILFAAQVPEAWSYTLTAAIATGRPIVGSSLGAIGERLAGLPNATIVPWDAPAAAWNDALVAALPPRAVPEASATTTQWPAYVDRLAVEEHPALVGRDDAGHDLDQRRLARAVLAQHRVDAAGLDGELGVLERAHAPVALRHAAHREQAHWIPLRSALRYSPLGRPVGLMAERGGAGVSGPAPASAFTSRSLRSAP